ncbi:hypothetical protein CDL15_Pgr020004 [Punica granatum]|uniref:Uncharacterized protein n=1 Tax=Punica granatum TaxID=22663 RepID=A0A218VRJ2_PUNGR|nr:hypothetical protein CDL15_Pgr020004 [Punica granatum]
MSRPCPRPDEEDCKLPIGRGQRPVSQTASISIAEGQGGSNDIYDQHVVPFKLGKYSGEKACGKCC